jgi:AcrR family transcriptional regulator
MENFFMIRAEKQEHIVNAAFKVFGRQGYRKASIGDIAHEAGITKGMVTYYFGSKKTLYLYLVKVVHSRLVKAVQDDSVLSIPDFFDRFKKMTEIKITAIKAHPTLIGFMNSLYTETDPSVIQDIEQIFCDVHSGGEYVITEGVDMALFKAGLDPTAICKFIEWADYGFLAELYGADCSDEIDNHAQNFYDCLDVIKEAVC